VTGFRTATLAIFFVASCAATGVTLRSNHFRVHVPPDWEVVETGGDSDRPTLLRTRPSTDGSAIAVELRLYAWLVQGPLADPAGDAYKRLAGAGSFDHYASNVADDDPESPCPGQHPDFVVFGKPARSLRFAMPTARSGMITAGYADGSLVAVVAIASPHPPACAEVEAMTSAIRRLAAAMVPSGDPSRPSPHPILLEDPFGRSIEVPAADPGPLSP
jgi:hypothetical protein